MAERLRRNFSFVRPASNSLLLEESQMKKHFFRMTVFSALIFLGCQHPSIPKVDLNLPGATFYPESLSASSNGTLYVGSFGEGKVLKFSPGSTTSAPFLPSGSGVRQVLGVLVDEADGSLVLCADDTRTEGAD